MIRIGVVGAGANTRSRHIPGFQAIDGVEVVAVCNRTMQSAQKVADEFGIPKVVATLNEMLAYDAIDAICIGTWPNMHAELTIASLKAGKHVLCEARMARDLAEAQQMLAASREHPELVAQIVPAPFSLDFDQRIRSLIEEGTIGKLREVRCTHTSTVNFDVNSPLSWRQDFSKSGKNIMLMGIVYETLERWVGEELDWLMADAEIFTQERRCEERNQMVRVQIPDTLSVLGRYASGARLAFHVSGVEAGPSVNSIALNGEKGSLHYELFSEKLLHCDFETGENRTIEPEESERVGWRVEEDFIDSIREGKPVTLTDFEKGVSYMKFTEAVHDSWTNASKKIALSEYTA